jgi:fatty acid desaturase
VRPPTYLTKAELASLLPVTGSRFVVKLGLLIALVSISIPLALSAHVISALCGTFLLGLWIAHAIELQHECLHGTAFRSSRWNRFFGILLGIPMLTSFTDYQLDHVRHHRTLGSAENREFFRYDYRKLFTWKSILVHLLMVNHLRHALGSLAVAPFANTRRDASPRKSGRIRAEYLLMLSLLFVGLVASGLLQTTVVLRVWLLPFFVSLACHALIEIPVHYACDALDPEVFGNTRTITAGRFAKWLTNGNNYHVEHHMYPHVPVRQLPNLHALLFNRLVVVDASYGRFYRALLESLFTGSFSLSDRGVGMQAAIRHE